MNVSVFGIIASIILVGASIEAVEGQNRRAAYALALLILLGIIVVNAQTFSVQFRMLMSALNARRLAPTGYSQSPSRTFGTGEAQTPTPRQSSEPKTATPVFKR